MTNEPVRAGLPADERFPELDAVIRWDSHTEAGILHGPEVWGLIRHTPGVERPYLVIVTGHDKTMALHTTWECVLWCHGYAAGFDDAEGKFA
ncbi:hypothetical protein [Streptomyces sp. NPDC087300]|uniref:hypothetical protein n=1 Tax=Streptomyces sp. NPDC087300 TaxID=3365780 RepID=UPI00382A51C5